MRYLLFAGDHYYPCGGWEDFICAGDDMEALKSTAGSLLSNDWWHIVEISTLQIVERSY